MTTTTSFSNQGRFASLYKSTLRRNLGYFGLISALILVFYPFQYAMELFKKLPEQSLVETTPLHRYDLVGLGYDFTSLSTAFFTAILLIVPLVLALHMNSYMHSKKASDVYHALPVGRGTLLSVNAAVAMTILAVPTLISAVLVSLLQIWKFGFQPVNIGYLFLDKAGWLIAAFTIYAVATFVCTLVGTVFDSFVYTCILLGTAPLLSVLYYMLASFFLFGFVVDDRWLLNILNLSPVLMMPARFLLTGVHDGYGTITPNEPEQLQMLSDSNLALLFYLVFSIALFVVSVRLYLRRSSEKAEITTTRGALPVFVKLVGTFSAGLLTGALFYSIFRGASGGKGNFLLWTLIGGMLAYVIMEAVFSRGFKTVVRSLPLGAGMVAVTLGVTAVFMTGGFGFEKRVPSETGVESVEVSYRGWLGDRMGWIGRFGAQEINQYGEMSWPVLESYRTVVLREEPNVQAVRSFHQQVTEEEYSSLYSGDEQRTQVSLTYRLKNGKTLSRRYYKMTDGAIERLLTIETSGEFLAQTNPAYFVKGEQISDWTLVDPFEIREYKIGQEWTAQESQELLDALAADAADLTLEELKNPYARPIAVLRFSAVPPQEGSERFCRRGDFAVTEQTARTYQLLEERKALDVLKGSSFTPETATAEVYRRADNCYQLNGDGMARSMLEGETFYAEDLEGVREEIEWIQSDPDREARDSGQYLFLTSDAAEIETLLENTSFYCRADEPVAIVKFYSGREGRTMLVPLSRLPETLQKKMTFYQR